MLSASASVTIQDLQAAQDAVILGTIGVVFLLGAALVGLAAVFFGVRQTTTERD